MLSTAQDAIAWLERHTQQPIHIAKWEQEDRDEVRLELDTVEIRNTKHFDLEEYASDEAILLTGSGKVITDDGTELPLPLETFEIPLAGYWEANEQDGRLVIITDRARYTISSGR